MLPWRYGTLCDTELYDYFGPEGKPCGISGRHHIPDDLNQTPVEGLRTPLVSVFVRGPNHPSLNHFTLGWILSENAVTGLYALRMGSWH